MKLTITQAHIDRANELKMARLVGSVRECPVALAASEALGKPCVAAYTHFRTEDGVHIFDAGNDMREWVLDFDNGKPVRPTTFEATERV